MNLIIQMNDQSDLCDCFLVRNEEDVEGEFTKASQEYAPRSEILSCTWEDLKIG